TCSPFNCYWYRLFTPDVVTHSCNDENRGPGKLEWRRSAKRFIVLGRDERDSHFFRRLRPPEGRGAGRTRILIPAPTNRGDTGDLTHQQTCERCRESSAAKMHRVHDAPRGTFALAVAPAPSRRQRALDVGKSPGFSGSSLVADSTRVGVANW